VPLFSGKLYGFLRLFLRFELSKTDAFSVNRDVGTPLPVVLSVMNAFHA